MTSLYHGALLFRVHLAGEELRLTSDYQLSRFFPLPAFPSPLWRVLAERVAHPAHTWFVLSPPSLLMHVILLAALCNSVPVCVSQCSRVHRPALVWGEIAPSLHD